MSAKAWQEGGPAHDSWSITGSLTSLPRDLLDEASTSYSTRSTGSPVGFSPPGMDEVLASNRTEGQDGESEGF